MFAIKELVRQEVKGEILKFLKSNENEIMTYQNLWDTVKEVLRGKFIARQTFIRK